ncbi:MAG: hypothetical protein ICV81_01905 [Flavisolibacter sp.]|nr:hypothetical protein [Flavisolibacter sp.]
MKSLKWLIVCAFSLTTIFISCKKEGNQNPTICRVTKVYIFNSGVRDDSASYFYTGSKVAKVQFGDSVYYTIEYNGDKVAQRKYFSGSASIPDGYDVISYNQDGTPSKIEGFVRINNVNINYSKVDFSYNAGKLEKTTTYENNGTSLVKLDESTFTYTGNNITKVTKVDITDGSQTTINYSYDDKNNYFKKQNSQFYFIDPYFIIDGFNSALAPLYFSSNNVNGLGSSGLIIPVEYILDEKQNLKAIKIAGETTLEYNNFCS